MMHVFFKSPIEFRAWLRKNHDRATELWIGFYKLSSGKEGITYTDALDEALCYGWIDAVRKNIDKDRWTIRITPRKPRSAWSLINIKHVKRLIKSGQMKPPGLEVFQRRDKKKSKIYSYEARNRPLEPQYRKRFKVDKKAWEFFQLQAPSYQKVARWWIISAKKEETRIRRVDALIEASRLKQRLDQFLSKK